MPSIIEGYSYDIFISYRQNDNKYDGWVTEFVDNLNKELEANIKDKISVYFDINPQDGLLETDSVDKSLEDKLKCLIFIPIISRTYCDSKSFAWQHEFCAFNKLAKEDKFGRDIKLSSGNVTSRILSVKIHDLDPEDKTLLEDEIGGFIRGIEFIYKEPGVNRPLKPEDDEKKNLNNTIYRNQINKVANAVKEIITALRKQSQQIGEVSKQDFEVKPVYQKNMKAKIISGSLIIIALMVLGYLFIPKLFKSKEQLEKSIAVLPFRNDSPNDTNTYFINGIMEKILNNLQMVNELRVISRTSVEQYRNTTKSIPEIARELGVKYIVEGSGQKYGNTFGVSVQLIKAVKEDHMWGKSYEQEIRETRDIISVQSRIAQAIAEELKATITPKEKELIENIPTTNQLAYDFYLKGKDYWSKYESNLALDMYSKAIQEDPLFAAAYAQRAHTHFYFYWNKLRGWQGHDSLGKEDLNKGLQLNPELPELKLVQAVAYYWLDRDYDKSLKILTELKAVVPNMADLYAYTSYILRRQGKMEESISELKKSIQLDPFNANYMDNLSLTYQLLHQYDNQIECSRQGLSLIPDYKSFNRFIFSAYLDKTGDLKVALKESGLKEENVLYGAHSYETQEEEVNHYGVYYYTRQYNKLIEIINKDTLIETNQTTYHPKTYELALIYYLNGNTSLCKIYADSAIIHLNGKIKEVPDDDRFYSTLGKCYAFTGNNKEAIACGQKAVDLKPIKLDAYQGAAKEQDLMEIYIFTGNYDLALDKIEYLLSIPSWLSIGDLLIDPIFDNLRKLPRFQKILTTEYKTNYQ
ncbi:MAG: hypothetical protein NTZ85_05185 [Bacteroidia bacterium]|nr:hypothetical protein [Bacteroidia bacterium]